MKRISLAIAATLSVATLAFAGPVEDREALMKERGKIAFGGLSPMAKGETPFDAAGALALLQQLQANAEKTDIDVLWAAGATGNTGDSPESSPKIWEDMAGFKAAEEKYEAAVAAAIAAPPADAAALGAAVGAIGKECGTCHEAYRVAKN
jgi:cytochrome c556